MERYVRSILSASIAVTFVLLSSHILCAQQQGNNTTPEILPDSLTRTRALDSLLQWRAIDTLPRQRFIGFNEFLAAVAAHNLDYAVQKYNVSLAQAQITVAKLYPDPAISVGYTKDISSVPADQKFGDVWSFGAAQTFPLGGKIGAGVNVAEQNESAAEAQTEEFFWTLRATAAQAYISALVADSNYKANERTYVNLAELSQINERRVGAGDLGKADLIQSRVD